LSEPWTAERARAFFDYEAQPREWVHACDLCGLSFRGPLSYVQVASRDRYGFPAGSAACLNCGLVFQGRPLAPAGLRALYAGPYRALVSAWHGRPINRETLEPEQRAYGRRLRAEILSARPHWIPTRVLDLGGSTGAVVSTVAAYAWLTLVEPCVAEAAAAARRVNRVVVQSAEDFEPGDERWDLILLCQAVDHLRSISTVLRKVRTWLAPGGRFFVDAVDSERIPEAERYKIDHVYALTPATMRRYLETAGFVAREVPAPSANHVAFLCEVKA
jgi:SAM-dependent methyltransferase